MASNVGPCESYLDAIYLATTSIDRLLDYAELFAGGGKRESRAAACMATATDTKRDRCSQLQMRCARMHDERFTRRVVRRCWTGSMLWLLRCSGSAASLAALAAAAACTIGPRLGASPSPAGPSALRVVSYNIHAGKDSEGRPSIPRVAALLDTLRADIVLLQEVDRGTQRSGGADQLGQLEHLTGLHGAFGKSLDYQGGDYGIGILARWPIDDATVLPLPADPPADRGEGAYEPRVALHAVVATPSGRMHVMNTHVGAERVGTYRRQELLALLARIHRRVPPAAPLIVGGDFNAQPHSDEVAAFDLVFTDAWATCGTAGGWTFPSGEPTRRIDYVFLRGIPCVDAQVPATTTSDHRPVDRKSVV